MERSGNRHGNVKRPVIEWIVGGISLVITVSLTGFIGLQALHDAPTRPQIETRVTSVTPSGDRYLVEITAYNRGEATAAGLNVEGTLTVRGLPPEKSSTTFDYVAGRSQRRGGLYFANNPAKGDLQVSAKGFQRP